ncbi:hypothetical protein HZS_5986 [Henneguya salminicola]|nr:hypothetical protein HZS_5986 [Henneguya salminicola]
MIILTKFKLFTLVLFYQNNNFWKYYEKTRFDLVIWNTCNFDDCESVNRIKHALESYNTEG